MWATNNNHADIVRFLLDHGASADVRSSAGRTATDFANASSNEIKGMVKSASNRTISGIGIENIDDFENSRSLTDPVSTFNSEGDLSRRLIAESAANLNVDLTNLVMEDPFPENDDNYDTEFDWEHCLPDQMFVFSAEDTSKIIDMAITRMQPTRSKFQKPVPANVLFLSARFAHYYGTPDLLTGLLMPAIERIAEIVEAHENDMAFLAFWLSNVTSLLYYLRKDAGMVEATAEYQQDLTELVSEIFVLLIRDAERRLDNVLDSAILDHETVPGLDDIQFQREWPFFRAPKKHEETEGSARKASDGGNHKNPKAQKDSGSLSLSNVRPPSPRKLAKPSPRNVTSLLSSTLFVLDLYDVHSIITLQIMRQIFYWLSATIFNRILSNRKYLARTRAMQIRLNVSALEDWTRVNDRRPIDISSPMVGGIRTGSVHESLSGSARRQLAPLIQLLQWLQCLSSLGDDTDSLSATIEQFTCLTAEQLLHVVKQYRTEVEEDKMSKMALKFLRNLEESQQQHMQQQKSSLETFAASVKKSKLFTQILPASVHEKQAQQHSPSTVSTELTNANEFKDISIDSPVTQKSAYGPQTSLDTVQINSNSQWDNSAITKHLKNLNIDMSSSNAANDDDPVTQQQPGIFMDISLILPFVLPTSTEMLMVWGAGIGGTDRTQTSKHIPVMPSEFVAKLDATSSLSTGAPSIKSGMTGIGTGLDGLSRDGSQGRQRYESGGSSRMEGYTEQRDSFQSDTSSIIDEYHGGRSI